MRIRRSPRALAFALRVFAAVAAVLSTFGTAGLEAHTLILLIRPLLLVVSEFQVRHIHWLLSDFELVLRSTPLLLLRLCFLKSRSLHLADFSIVIVVVVTFLILLLAAILGIALLLSIRLVILVVVVLVALALDLCLRLCGFRLIGACEFLVVVTETLNTFHDRFEFLILH